MPRGLGFVRRLLLLALVPAATGSCLVISDPDFRGQDDCVPFFITHQAQPLVSDRPRIPESPGDPTEFRGTVPFRSCALVKDYVARIFVDGSLRSEQVVPATGSEERTLEVSIDVGQLPQTGCHFVEVFLSTQFAAVGADFRSPARRGDLAFLLWTFVDSTDATVASCRGGS
jgi:hypothetical protein